MKVESKRRGRPARAEATRRALEMLGCDPAEIDPLQILAAIAADVSAPAVARVAACRTLLAQARIGGKRGAHDATTDPVSARAVALLTELSRSRN